MSNLIIVLLLCIVHSMFAGQFEKTIHDAVYNENIGLIEWLVKNSHDINATDSSYGQTPLSLAMRHKNMRVFNTLFRCGADINARDFNSHALIHRAVFCHSHEMVDMLLARGARLNVYTVDGRTPLHLAVYSHDRKMVPLLLWHAQRAGILDKWLNHEDEKGWTPVVLAANAENDFVYDLLNDPKAIQDAIDCYSIDRWRGNVSIRQKLINRQLGI